MTTITIQYATLSSLYLSVDNTGRLLFSTTPSKWDTNNPVTSENFQNVTLKLNSPGNVNDKKYLCCPPNPAPGNIFLMESDGRSAARFTQVGPNVGGFPIFINDYPGALLNRTLQNTVVIGGDGSQGFVVTVK
jgi:hypothetical protein